MKANLYSWRVVVRLPADGYGTFYIVAETKASANYQAKIMAEWTNPSRTSKNVWTCKVIEKLT